MLELTRAIVSRSSIFAVLLFLIIGLHPKKAVAQYYDEIDMIHDARDTLEGWHAYQPVFNGLKYRHGPWEDRITSGFGVRFFNKEMVTTSLSLVLSTDYDQIGKNFASQAEVESLCLNQSITTGEVISSAQIRLIGLCALDKCERYSEQNWKQVIQGVKNNIRNNDLRHKASIASAADAVFIARVGYQCNYLDTAGELLNLSKPLVDSALSIYQKCATKKCAVEDTNFAYSVVPVAASVLISLNDIPEIPSELLHATQSYWQYRNYDISDIVDDRVDKNILELCENANYPADTCRDQFKYSFFLERHFLSRMSNLPKDTNVREAVAQFQKDFADEILIRNSDK